MNLIHRTPAQERQVRRVLQRLVHDLGGRYRELADQISRLPAQPEQVLALMQVAVRYAQMMRDCTALLNSTAVQQAGQALQGLRACSADLTGLLEAQPEHHYLARRGILGAISLISCADQGLAAVQAAYPEAALRRIQVSSDLLFQGFFSLFPAERMAVVAGRRAPGGVVTLGAVFDVTGAGSAGHVRADPAALGRALIAMENAGTFLAAWLHSHPGGGPEATRPSGIDRTQHADWIKDYSAALLSGIFVQDGWLRFWGSALENHQIEVEVLGGGIQKEGSDEWIYQIRS
jgi:proteasome lid subunit RPN8/RPN11